MKNSCAKTCRRQLSACVPATHISLPKTLTALSKRSKKTISRLLFWISVCPVKPDLSLPRQSEACVPEINIIIVTAYEEYALNALRLYVSGYILKPVIDSELKEALDNLRVPVTKKDIGQKAYGKMLRTF